MLQIKSSFSKMKSSSSKELNLEKKITLNDISRFSPPHISILESYPPTSKKYNLSTAKRPPAIVGDLKMSLDHSKRPIFQKKICFQNHFMQC